MKHGQGRAFIIATKLRTRQPPYLDIPLVDTSAAGDLGEAGVDGWIDSHFWERFGGALMVGMIPILAHGHPTARVKRPQYGLYGKQPPGYGRYGTYHAGEQHQYSPTLYKNQGEIINLITGEDIDFSNIYTLRLKNDR